MNMKNIKKNERKLCMGEGVRFGLVFPAVLAFKAQCNTHVDLQVK